MYCRNLLVLYNPAVLYSFSLDGKVLSGYIHLMKGIGVFHILSENSRAQLEGEFSLVDGLGVARWRNDEDRVRYPGADHHTLSIYISGHNNAERTDYPVKGVDGSYCLLPAGAESEWRMSGPISFTHMYFHDKIVKDLAEKVFDKSGAGWSIPDKTYQQDRQLLLLSQWLLHASLDDMKRDPMLTEQNIMLVMVYLLSRLFRQDIAPIAKGGLSIRNKRLITEYIHANHGHPILLKDMSRVAGISEFHFQRMFKQTFHMTPHEYLNRVRIENAENLILQDMSLSRVGQETGFSSQPHFTRVFQKITGLTPGTFKKCHADRIRRKKTAE